MTKQNFIRHLIEKNNFKQVGETLVYQDGCDFIVVSIQPSAVIVIADGFGVIPSWNIIQVFQSDGDEWVYGGWDELLQLVLHKF